jgi:phospholipase C
VSARVDRTKRAVELTFHNMGKAAAVLHVRSSDGKTGPWSYTVGPMGELSDSFPVSESAYSMSVYGPNGFFRAFAGSLADGSGAVEVGETYPVTKSGDGVEEPGIMLTLRNADGGAREIKIRDGYTQKTKTLALAAGETKEHHWALGTSFGWYDLTVETDSHFKRHIAGHVETGRDSMTDPAMGKA